MAYIVVIKDGRIYELKGQSLMARFWWNGEHTDVFPGQVLGNGR